MQILADLCLRIRTEAEVLLALSVILWKRCSSCLTPSPPMASMIMEGENKFTWNSMRFGVHPVSGQRISPGWMVVWSLVGWTPANYIAPVSNRWNIIIIATKSYCECDFRWCVFFYSDSHINPHHLSIFSYNKLKPGVVGKIITVNTTKTPAPRNNWGMLHPNLVYYIILLPITLCCSPISN